MKKVLNKISEVLSWIFGYGMMICLFVGGFSFFGYLVAIIIGGDTATQICDFIYKELFKYLVYTTSILVLLGLVKMYLSGQTALTSGKRKQKVVEKAEEKKQADTQTEQVSIQVSIQENK